MGGKWLQTDCHGKASGDGGQSRTTHADGANDRQPIATGGIDPWNRPSRCLNREREKSSHTFKVLALVG
jgi:hypothetical protein